MKTSGSLLLNPGLEIDRIIKFIQEIYEEIEREGAIIALSGGLDSAVTAQLLVNSLGRENVQLLYMPEADSKRIHGEHAQKFSNKLGIPLKVKNISPVLRKMGAYRLLPIGFVPGKWLRGKLVEFGRSKMFAGREKSILTSRLKSRGNSLVSRGNAYGMAKQGQG
jgi:NAD+ synthase